MKIPFPKFTACLTLAFSLALPAWPQEATSPLTLQEALARAIWSNPKLKAAKAKLGISDAELLTASARQNPILMSDNGIAENTYRLGITQTIELGGKRKRRIAVSEAQREIVLAEMDSELLALRQDVKKTFCELYYLQQKQDIHHRLLSLHRQSAADTDIRNGDGAEALQTQIDLADKENDLQALQLQAAHARNRLASLMHIPPNGVLHLAEPTEPDLDIDNAEEDDKQLRTLVALALQNRSEIRKINHQLSIAKAQEALAKSKRIPNLTVSAGPDLVTNPNVVSAFIMGNMELPVFDRQQGPLAEAGAKMFQLEQEKEATKSQIELEVRNAHAAYLVRQRIVKRYREQILPNTLALLEKTGKQAAIEVEKTHLAAKLAYFDAVLELQAAVTELQKALGESP